ncbi:MAG: WHG domain-containing protein [Gemmatimonadaceae bacterium]
MSIHGRYNNNAELATIESGPRAHHRASLLGNYWDRSKPRTLRLVTPLPALELAAAVANEGFRRLEAKLEAAIPDAGADPVERLISVCLAYVGFAQKHPHLYRVMYAQDLSDRLDKLGSEPTSEKRHYELLKSEKRFYELLQTKAGLFGLFVNLIRDGQRAGRLVSGPSSDIARVPASLAHGLSHEFIDERLGTRIDRDKHARQIFSLMLKGLEKPLL